MEEQFDTVDQTYRGNLWCTPQERRDWRLYVTELDNDPRNHFEGLDMIRTAEEEDVIEILITSPGGRVDIADMYLAAFRDSKAKIITRAIGECASAATTIFLAGDERICEDGCYFMFHNVQLGSGGDSAHVIARSKFYERLFKEKFYGMMAEVLTPLELAELFERAGEIYLTAEEMRERLQNSERREQILSRFGSGKLPEPASQDEGILLPIGEVISLPFPETKVLSAEDFPQGDEFDITLDDGYKKVFRLSTLCPKDFDEYNMDEIEEIGIAFGLDLDPSQNTRQQALECLIEEILAGSQFYVGEED
ncbi:ATP-dependent protease [Cronobacter phage CR3]|uniref:Putative ClpP ATP-dependent protease subunit n=2 Tax=Certrevirus TaxID=1914850 RepID=I1TRP7_9CAUD|nr:ATP-dependent protease [Cronobacter phage CR3]YP_009188908.1 ATP-dependent protease [Cronobacter phage PBES 02]AFH21370.1 putative ClpP ATP-dependent protease subunit [Cronobacter phage CR3]AKY03947.1 putative ClpP ATP-dependent protease subunit [Cronobacter phage PBES 02]